MAIELDPLAGEKGGEKSRRLASFWKDQIGQLKEASDMQRWFKRGETIEKRYRDERSRTDEDGQRRYNSLWSNVEILKPALYGKMPLPIAERRFKDKDPTGRFASQMLERALRNEIEISGYDKAMQQVVSDYLLPGRGVCWVRYEPEIEEGISLPVETEIDIKDSLGPIVDKPKRTEGTDQSEETPWQRRSGAEKPQLNKPPEEDLEAEDDLEIEKLAETGDRILRESTPVDYIPWRDFLIFPLRSRSWAEVTAIGKRVFFSRKQACGRFGKEIGKKLPLHRDDRGQSTNNSAIQAYDEDKVVLYEIWNKQNKDVIWISEGYEYLLDRKDDPLKLEHFFPCPEPLFANPTNNTIIPVPDYLQYQDQAVQIDELTQRIAMLTKACKIAGVYDAREKDLQRLLNESVENELIPVDNWAAFAEKGGIEGSISLLPVKDIVGVLNELMMCKQKQIEEMDRLTGINDIMRGTSDARETLGGVRLKANNTGTRLTARQNEVARFARDVIRIMADIMCQHFSPQSLIDVSGALYEEGLGPDDMPSLTTLQKPEPPPQPAPQPQQPPQQAGMQSPMQGGPPQPQGMSSQMPPQGQPMGQNVIPFRPPQAPSPGMAGGMPPNGPQMPMGAGVPQIPPEVQAKIVAFTRIGKAISLLRNERLRGFRVDIEVDSTIFPDAAQEKSDRTAFIQQVTGFLQTSFAIGQQMPTAIPLLVKMLQFTVRGYRVGRDFETAIEEFGDTAIKEAQKAQIMAAQQPNPEQMKLQAEAKRADAQAQAALIQAQTEAMRAKTEVQAAQVQAQADQAQAQAEVQRQQLENQGEQANSEADLMQKHMDVQMQQMEMQIEAMRAKFEQELEELKLKTEEKKAETQEKIAKLKIKQSEAQAKKAAQKPKGSSK